MKFKNLLTAAIAVVASVGISSQSFAIPVSIDTQGFVTSYIYSGSVDPFAGSINVGDIFSSSTVVDPDTAVDLNGSNNVGWYQWHGGLFGNDIVVGNSISLSNQSVYLSVYDDYTSGSVTFDSFRIHSGLFTNGDERISFSLGLYDFTAQGLDDDSLVLEPDLTMFPNTYFSIVSYDSNNSVNYSIYGTLFNLVDPPVQASVPEPSTILLLGLGLLFLFYVSGRKTINLDNDLVTN